MTKAPVKSAGSGPGPKSSAAGEKRWSGEVTKHSNALDLEEGVFKKRSAKQVALSLKRSAEHSKRRKGTPFQSAMSMLNFEINRAGKGMSAERRHILENAKDELRKAFDRR
jgi:hypothetical protein